MPRCENIFELSNHLENVLSSISDKLIAKDWNSREVSNAITRGLGRVSGQVKVNVTYDISRVPDSEGVGLDGVTIKFK